MSNPKSKVAQNLISELKNAARDLNLPNGQLLERGDLSNLEGALNTFLDLLKNQKNKERDEDHLLTSAKTDVKRNFDIDEVMQFIFQLASGGSHARSGRELAPGA